MSKYDPDHYQLGKIEVWDFIVDQDLGFLEGNIIKYLCRAGYKEGESRLDDLLKAKTYLQKLIETTPYVESGSPRTSTSVQSSDVPTSRGLLPECFEYPTGSSR